MNEIDIEFGQMKEKQQNDKILTGHLELGKVGFVRI
jgi:hypothetical protein